MSMRIRCKRPVVAKLRRMEQAVFKKIVEMAYEMNAREDWIKDTSHQITQWIDEAYPNGKGLPIPRIPTLTCNRYTMALKDFKFKHPVLKKPLVNIYVLGERTDRGSVEVKMDLSLRLMDYTQEQILKQCGHIRMVTYSTTKCRKKVIESLTETLPIQLESSLLLLETSPQSRIKKSRSIVDLQ